MSLLLDKHGNVISSTDSKLIGLNMSEQEVFTLGLNKPYGDVYISEPHCSPNLGINCICFSAPIFLKPDGGVCGVIINDFNIEALNEITTCMEKAGNTDELYLVGTNGIMLTESRFEENAVLSRKVDSEPVRNLTGGVNETAGIYRNYKDVPVVGAAIAIPEYRWILIAEISKKEAFAPLRFLGNIALIIGILSVSITSGAGIAFAMSASRPVMQLKSATERFAKGELDYRVNVTCKGEVGDLARSFNTMAEQISREITERRKMEELKQRFVNIIETAADFISTANKNGQVNYLNRAGRRLMGIGEGEDISKTTIPQYHPEWASKIILNKGLPAAMRDGIWIGETALLRRDGFEIPVSQIIIAHKFADEQIEFLSTIMRDLRPHLQIEEERSRLKEQLYHAQRIESIGQLAGGVAHNFNNILTVITGYASLLQMEMKKDDPLQEYAQHILVSAEKGASVTKGLLLFSRKHGINTKPVDLNFIVKKMKALLTELIEENIELKILLLDKELAVMADSVQIEQVIMNLVTNARDAMPMGGSLEIKTDEMELSSETIHKLGYGEVAKYAVISVSDTGNGISKEIQEKIFEPFFTTKEVGKGTGLGLAMAHGIILQHHGYIEVESEVGKGTTFRIYLPLIKSHKIEADIQLDEPSYSEGKGEVILVAEDDDEIRKLLKKVLEMGGYTVIEAIDGKEAVCKFRENSERIHCLVFDLILPGMNGNEAYETIRKMQPDIKIIFISGYFKDSIIGDSFTDDKLNFITKPITPAYFLKTIRGVLDA